MYNNVSSAAGTGAAASGGALAATGAQVLWLFLAAFALIAVGTALARIVPRRNK
ncbi:peptidase [Streptomyces sp. NPDC050095]|uniref:peptidase n=1 Tax=unclassified Streptomyces TaxID=2593676 RepID=UPI003439B561